MNALEVRGLRKTYPAFTLKDVSFDVPQGAVVGFIGRNGAGKSTTLKSILGLVHPDGGHVRFFGQDVRQHEREFKEQIGVVLGGIDFYPKKKVKTITDVTRRFYRNWDETKYRHYLELFGIDESKRVDQLSSGMKVKYLLALALSHNAKLLILDEPTNGLDPSGIQQMRNLIKDMPNRCGATVLISSHLLGEMEQMVDQVGIINHGRLLFQGELDDLRKHSQGDISLRVLHPEKAAPILGNSARLERGVFHLPAMDEARLAELIGRLAAAQAGVVELNRATKTLEEIFLSLTGVDAK